MHEKVQLWRDTKQEILSLTRAVVNTINRVAGDIAAQCGQRPCTEFYIESGAAQVYLHSTGIFISDHRAATALSENWKGTLSEWAAVKAQLVRLSDPIVMMEELTSRL